MYRVLLATLLALLAVQLSGCTGSLRLGSSVNVVADEHLLARV